jgi:hypothetical protein
MYEIDRLKTLADAPDAPAPVKREVTLHVPQNFQVAWASNHSHIVLVLDPVLPSSQHFGLTIEGAEKLGRELIETARQQRLARQRVTIAVPRKRLILPR